VLRAAKWLWRAAEVAGTVAWLGSIGGAAVIAAVVAFFADFPLLLRAAVFAGSFLIALAVLLSVIQWVRARSRRERESAREPERLRRVGYLGRGEASRANLSDARFSKELDVGAESEGEVDARRARFGDDLSEDDPKERPDA
jgi:predicted lysophospholipase L1 biosynthesis ABC-type transport system permease subunit